MAADIEIHTDLKTGDYSDALNHASYHLPFIGAGRNTWDALQDNKPWQAAAHAGLLGLEVVGFRAAGKVRWGGNFFRNTQYLNEVLGQTKLKNLHAFPESVTASVRNNFKRFMNKIPANSKQSASFRKLEGGNYLFEATSPGNVPGSKAIYQKWVNSEGKTFKMLKTTVGADGKIIHAKPK